MPDNNLELRLTLGSYVIVPALRAVRRAIQAVTDAADEQQRALAEVARRIEGLGDATELSTPSLARMASADRGVLEGRGRALGARGQRTFARVTNTSKTPAAVRLRPKIIPPT